jgi:DNA-binding transcriptional LysR family regulator
MDLLRHLRFFAAVADARHFGHAAQDLGMTQPPLSQGIQRLERHLGVRLFDRDARGVQITPAGHRLLPEARELLRAAAELEQLANDFAEPTQVRVGLADDLEGWTPRLLGTLASNAVEAVPELAGSVQLVDRLHDGLLDVAVVRHPGVLDGLVSGEVHRLPTRLCGPDGGSWTNLADCPLPLVEPPRHHQPAAHDQFVDALRRAGHHGGVVESEQPAQRRALVAAGRVAQLVPSLDAEDRDLPPLRVRVVLPADRARRPDVDHERIAALLDETLGQTGA